MRAPNKRTRGGRDRRDRDEQPQRRHHHTGDEDGDGGIVTGALRYVKDGARAAGKQIQRTLSDTTGTVLDTVLEEAEQLYEQQRKNALSRVSSLSKIAARSAHALHAVKADGVAEYVEQAAKQVERSRDYLRERELAEILEDAGDVIRRNRGAAMGAMFIAGFAVTRFLKASASREPEGQDDSAEEEQAPRRAMRKRRQGG